MPILARLLLTVFCTLYFGSGLGAGAFLFTRRENYDAIGGFDEQYFAAEEIYFSLALKKLGPFRILREPATTSGRKLRMYNMRHVLMQLFALALGGQALFDPEKGSASGTTASENKNQHESKEKKIGSGEISYRDRKNAGGNWPVS